MTRFPCIHEKIPRETTGLKADLYVHVDHTPAGEFISLRFSNKAKDGGILDNMLTTLGDVATDIIKNLPGNRP